MEKIILLGCGGHAKSMADSIESLGKYEIVGFVGTESDKDFSYKTYKCIARDEDLKELYDSGIKNAAISMGFMGGFSPREKLFESLQNIGYNLPAIIDKSAAVASDAKIGAASFVGKNAVINANATLGKLAIINSAAVVEHDCTFGDNVHLSVGAVACGNVTVGSDTFLGASSTIIQGKVIGDNVLLGAGSLVLTDVPDNVKVYGLVK